MICLQKYFFFIGIPPRGTPEWFLEIFNVIPNAPNFFNQFSSKSAVLSLLASSYTQISMFIILGSSVWRLMLFVVVVSDDLVDVDVVYRCRKMLSKQSFINCSPLNTVMIIDLKLLKK